MSQPEGKPRCSAKGCARSATVALRWNNPRLHPPERRKTWLACDEHETSLSQFLGARGFLRETEPSP
jgi:hypothetical protein